jgi:hypothetical protein
VEPEQDADGDGEVKREVGDTEQVDQARIEPRVLEVRNTGEGGYVSFEWIGESNYLNEPRGYVRGENVTSLDALMRVMLDDETLALLVIEWKYLESYGGRVLLVPRAALTALPSTAR